MGGVVQKCFQKGGWGAAAPSAPSLNPPMNIWQSAVFPLHQGSTKSRKTLQQKFVFQIGTLNPHGINCHEEKTNSQVIISRSDITSFCRFIIHHCVIIIAASFSFSSRVYELLIQYE